MIAWIIHEFSEIHVHAVSGENKMDSKSRYLLNLDLRMTNQTEQYCVTGAFSPCKH